MPSATVVVMKWLDSAGEGTILPERDRAMVSERELPSHTGGRRSHGEDSGHPPEIPLLRVQGLMGWDKVGLIPGQILFFFL